MSEESNRLSVLLALLRNASYHARLAQASADRIWAAQGAADEWQGFIADHSRLVKQADAAQAEIEQLFAAATTEPPVPPLTPAEISILRQMMRQLVQEGETE